MALLIKMSNIMAPVIETLKNFFISFLKPLKKFSLQTRTVKFEALNFDIEFINRYNFKINLIIKI